VFSGNNTNAVFSGLYSRGSEFATVPYRVRTVPYRTVPVPCPYRTVPFSVFFTVPFFTASATVTVPYYRLTVRSAKRTEPLIVTVRFLVFDREPYRTKMETVIRLLLRTANRTSFSAVRIAVPQQNWSGV
jgi:hypothetical protein